jgi:hypothetical protein
MRSSANMIAVIQGHRTRRSRICSGCWSLFDENRPHEIGVGTRRSQSRIPLMSPALPVGVSSDRICLIEKAQRYVIVADADDTYMRPVRPSAPSAPMPRGTRTSSLCGVLERCGRLFHSPGGIAS